MELRQNAPILAANGDAVGRLDRVVVNPESKVITHIIVQTGGLVKKAGKVVPLSLIAEASDEHIKLREGAGDLQQMQSFEEKQYVMQGDASAAAPVVSQPLAGMPGAVVEESRPKYVKQVEQHIPEGTVALKEGATVVAADGKHVGHVEKLITDVEADRATYMLVSKGLLAKEHKLVPMTWVGLIDENQVHLTVDPQKLDELAALPT